MPDMDEIIRRIRRDMDTELRKRARRALPTAGAGDRPAGVIPAQPRPPGAGHPVAAAPAGQPECAQRPE
ncbi:hypothetical protein ABZ419_05670 [Streptomyces cinnamoneus]|uniref:hypothetical protein n=1 Tax=Streptomyces cinnamoneus TaxID=53446 RepID=UPI0033DAD19E